MKKYTIKTPNEFRDFCSTLNPIWAFDCETTSLKWLDLEMIGFSLCDGKQACYVQLNPSNKNKILSVLDYYIHESKMIVMHNSPFDLMCLRKEGIEI